MTSTGSALLRLLRGADVYAPEHVGRRDILVGGGRILQMGASLAEFAHAGIEVGDVGGLRLVPGFVDQHIHLLGGGDAAGPLGRVAELTPEDLALAGITTAVGVVGVEMEARGLLLLLRKVHELTRAGLTALMYTGSFRLPAPCMLTSVRADVAFIDQVMGVKTAVSERFYPNQDAAALMQLAGEMLQARAMTGKAAVLHCHMGGMAEGMAPLFELVERLGMPPSQIVPTHVNRTAAFSPVFDHAMRFARLGGTIDFSCCVSHRDGNPTGVDVHDAVRQSLDAGVPLERLSFSSDSNVPAAVRGAAGELLGMRVVPPTVLHRDLMRIVHEAGVPLAQALTLITTNVARGLGLQQRKGALRPGMDADLVALDAQDRIHAVMAGGEWLVQGGRAIPRGPFAPVRVHAAEGTRT